LQSEYDFLKNTLQNYEQKVSDLSIMEISETDYNQAKRLLKNKTFYETKENERIQRLNSKHHKQKQLTAKIENLSLPLDIDQLKELHFPIYTENSWQQLKNESEFLQEENRNLNLERKEIKEEHQFLTNQVNEVEREMLSENELDQLKQQVNLTEEEQVRVRMQAEKKEQEKKWSRVYEQEEKKRRRSTMMFGGLAIIAAGYALLQATNWLYFIALLYILFGLSSWLVGKRSLADMRRLLQTEEQSIDQ